MPTPQISTAYSEFETIISRLRARLLAGVLPNSFVTPAIQKILEGKTLGGGILDFVATFKCESVAKFVTRDVFKVGAHIGSLEVEWIGPNFEAAFRDVVEVDVPTCLVNVWRLTKSTRDTAIIDLFGVSKARLHLAYISQIITSTVPLPHVKSGDTSIAYAFSPITRQLMAVWWRISGSGKLRLEAISTSSEVGWRHGRLIFSL